MKARFALAFLLAAWTPARAADEALIAAAKREGQLTWYTTQIVNQFARPAAEAFEKKYGIKVIRSPIYLWHSSIHNRGSVPEYDNITTSANSFTADDLRQMYLYGWTTQAFHSLGLLEYIAKFYHQLFDLSYVGFYETLIDYCKATTGKFNREYQILLDYMETGYAGKGWDHYDPDLAPIYWPIEEATWLRCVTDSAVLETETLEFLKFLQDRLKLPVNPEILEDLVRFQVFLLSTMDHKAPVKSFHAKFAWKEFLVEGRDSLDELDAIATEYSWNNKVTLENKAEWCYKAIWVGRNQGNYKCHPEFLDANPPNRRLAAPPAVNPREPQPAALTGQDAS